MWEELGWSGLTMIKFNWALVDSTGNPGAQMAPYNCLALSQGGWAFIFLHWPVIRWICLWKQNITLGKKLCSAEEDRKPKRETTESHELPIAGEGVNGHGMGKDQWPIQYSLQGDNKSVAPLSLF